MDIYIPDHAVRAEWLACAYNIQRGQVQEHQSGYHVVLRRISMKKGGDKQISLINEHGDHSAETN